MKIKRSERLIDITHYLLEHPHTLVSLTFFSKRYESAKSSISEDLTIVKKTFSERGIGIIETVPGAAGGARYIPKMKKEDIEGIIQELCDELNHSERLLPGGYVYLSDMLGQPDWLRKIGRVIASFYMDKEIDAVMTVATKGVPIAQAVATYLNVPFVIVRRDSKVTEGSTVSINYVSGSSSQRVEKMELSRRSLKRGSRVLIVDDFLKGGGTVNGMKSLIEEFDAELVGATVIAENIYQGVRSIDNYTALLKVDSVDVESRTIQVVPGNFIAYL
ncbi:pur operon repressor [Marinilactibacillus sp. 15R]|uniref:Purine operon repressor, PurR n=1 Tax=Marinilactibacillus piezotolerans TaxID=258723 RepID=A0A1I3ZIZ9_9LACT|nr:MULTISPECIES: pur operon repressor [Marinilactibacillus]API87943.1 pur operon repressor [Marinilactibacillus sp. 15R]SFK44027.1 purine operon repressor, PurR [Marinilactibacillus piezotolerans]